MNKTLKNILLLFLFFVAPLLSFAQKSGKTSAQKSGKADAQKSANTDKMSATEIEAYKQRVKYMVSVLEFSLNTLGNDSSSASDKDAIINKSFLKFFKDAKVQVEDDLDENRKVVTYKNIQSYLQDVDYFFKYVAFEFNVEEVSHQVDEKNRVFFKVTMTRNLKGITIDDEKIFNIKKRYIEVNLDVKEKDLKIASIYTTKISEEEELRKWWSELNQEWKNILRKEMGTIDSINYGALVRITNTEVLDLSNNKNISDLEPLIKLSKLKELRISNTNINSLIPIRNLTRLEILAVDNTPIGSLEPLKYSTNLKELYCFNTPIQSLEPLKIFGKLEKLHSYKTKVDSLDPISGLVNLKDLQLMGTQIANLEPLANLKNLEVLNISETEVDSLHPLENLFALQQLYSSNTEVSDLSPLKKLKNLRILFLNHTKVKDLAALKSLASLEKVYCDHSEVKKEEATQFMTAKPGTLVIYGSESLNNWWNGLNEEWKNTFKKYLEVYDQPSKEQLASIANIHTMDISGKAGISSLAPVKEAVNLKELYLNKTSVSSLDPIKDLMFLEIVEFANSKVASLEPLNNLKGLKKINCDNTDVDSASIAQFIVDHLKCLVVYKSDYLYSWWDGLSDEWKSVFRKHVKLDAAPTKEQLHKLVKIDSISFNNVSVNNLEALKELPELKVLTFSNTSISNLEPIKHLKELQVLRCSKNPIKDITPLASLENLKVLELENTAVNNLEPIKGLIQLEYLDFSGAPVKDLKDLEKLVNLSFLNCSTTGIKSLKPIEKLSSLKKLKCYNTRLSASKVEKFKKKNPECDVIYY